MIFQQYLESLAKENNQKVNKNKQGQKINLKTLHCSVENSLHYKENKRIMNQSRVPATWNNYEY